MKNWKAMSEKEQLKRMNELSKKLLNKTEGFKKNDNLIVTENKQ